MQEEISTYKKLKDSKSGFGIAGMTQEEIIVNLPHVVKDVS